MPINLVPYDYNSCNLQGISCDFQNSLTPSTPDIFELHSNGFYSRKFQGGGCPKRRWGHEEQTMPPYTKCTPLTGWQISKLQTTLKVSTPLIQVWGKYIVGNTKVSV